VVDCSQEFEEVKRGTKVESGKFILKEISESQLGRAENITSYSVQLGQLIKGVKIRVQLEGFEEKVGEKFILYKRVEFRSVGREGNLREKISVGISEV
jgi:hypothetical protein